MKTIHVKVHVNGIVQGVGFRPFIHKQIDVHTLTGTVRNTASGAELELEGEEARVRKFIEELWTKKPRLAMIESVETELQPELAGFTDFRIIQSLADEEKNTLVSPDVCICEDCLREMRDPENRRYRYPFLNCTNCGPRFTIVKEVPYDRARTTMAPFPMCKPCADEYGDIEDRRYHAQPTCCPDCGPQLLYYGKDGKAIVDVNAIYRVPPEGGRTSEKSISPATNRECMFPATNRECNEEALRLAREALLAGKIIAVKGLGGVHLACRIDRPEIAAELRRRKERSKKPFALMVRDTETARQFCEVSPEEQAVLESHQRPIVLLRKKDPNALCHISENAYVGVMLPYTPLHYLLFEEPVDALVMTSANLSDTPIVKDNDEALRRLSGIADGFLLNNREIRIHCDDSLCWVVDGKEYFARRSRGYVPHPVFRKEGGELLALGAEQKATFTLTKGCHAFQSRHIGDLKNAETLADYEAQIRHMEGLFGIKPALLISDLHPDYLSTGYGEERAKAENLPLMRVAHHHAHMASCMAENDLDEDVIGIIWDGTGLGPDGTIWGGEFLTGGLQTYRRFGHIRPVKLAGGDKATEEPWRIGAAKLLDAGISEAEITDFFRTHLAPKQSIAQVLAMLRADFRSPESAGMGRLFDAVSAILGICDTASYEGEGAVLLEAAMAKGGLTADDAAEQGTYPITLAHTNEGVIFDDRDMMREIFREAKALQSLCAFGADLQKEGQEEAREDAKKKALARIAARFHNTLVELAIQMCESIQKETGLAKVVLSGGSFQNQYILKRLLKELPAHGFRVYHHQKVSANDEGISFGQAAIAEKGGETYVPCSTL